MSDPDKCTSDKHNSLFVNYTIIAQTFESNHCKTSGFKLFINCFSQNFDIVL